MKDALVTKTLSAVVIAIGFAYPGVASADASRAATTCEASGITPRTESSYVNTCFTMSASLALDFVHGTFTLSTVYSRLSCGGWPPYVSPVTGTVQSSGGDRYRLVGDDGSVAEIDLSTPASGVYTSASVDWRLDCSAASAHP